METPEFEWDDEKALSNFKKHNVSFEERRLLVVVHIERNERIRLISCGKATNAERKTYEKS
jgi:uncharacterized DUF497 family protein